MNFDPSHYDEAIWLYPQDADAFNNRGLEYRAKGDTDRAIADFSEASRLDPDFNPFSSGC